MNWTSWTASSAPRNRSTRSVANFRMGSVISICRPVISILIDPPCETRGSGPRLLRSDAALMGTGNPQIFAIFRDAATRNGYALFFQHLGNFFVGQRISRILVLDVFLYLPFDNKQ